MTPPPATGGFAVPGPRLWTGRADGTMNNMTEPASPHPQGTPAPGQHLATISHLGRFWDVYVEFTDDPRWPDTHRARLAFSPADPGDHEETVRTATIIIEPSFDAAMRTARSFDNHHFVALLRSALPETE